MTFEQILLLYLYQFKKVSINLFGTIELEGVVPEPEILKKERQMPVSGIRFTFNAAVATDEEFIRFYAYERGIIYPLAASDIELHLHMAKQIVNIGNPFDIPGAGKIIKLDNGNLSMIPGYFQIPPPSGSGRPVELRERGKEPTLPPLTRDEKRRGRKAKKGIKPVIAVSAVLIIIVLLVFGYLKILLPALQPKEQKTETVVNPSANLPDSIPDASTSINQQDSLQTPLIDTNTIVTWKAYIAKTNNAAFADSRLKRYKSYGHDVKLETPDTSTFLIYLPINSSIADTARKKDSLSKFFAYKVELRRMNP